LLGIGSALPSALRHPGELRGHVVELVYAVLSIIGVGVMTVVTIAIYRLSLEQLVARVTAPIVGTVVAWSIAAVFVVLTALSLLYEVRGSRR
jgi:hypothetical protein